MFVLIISSSLKFERKVVQPFDDKKIRSDQQSQTEKEHDEWDGRKFSSEDAKLNSSESAKVNTTRIYINAYPF